MASAALSSATFALSSLSLAFSSSASPTITSSLPKSSIFGSLPKCFLVSSPSKPPHPLSSTISASIVFLNDEEESPEDSRRAYEALYGPAFSKISTKKSSSGMGKDDDGPGQRGRRGGRGVKDGMEEKVVQIRRVTKVVKGGKQLSFRAIVVVGDKMGRVGVGVGKAKEVIIAVQKSAADARRHLVTVPMTKGRTFPHRADGKYGAAKVMLRPAAPGTGVIAGGSVRVVLELAGVVSALGKELGSKNPLNNARAVIEAVSSMKTFRDVANDRGIPMEELWK